MENTSNARPTRYPEIGYQKVAPDLWRFIALETGCAVGPHFKTKAELLADLTRYAEEYTGVTPPAPLTPNLNGLTVTRQGTVNFIPLPRELWRPSAGPCQCGKCDGSGMWDTLAVSEKVGYSWTVHYPELHKRT